MAGLFVFVASPAQYSTVGRSIQLSGSVGGAGSGSVSWVSIQLGAGGPTVKPNGRENWSWQGLIPNNIRPGQAFQIIVTASGVIQTKGWPEPEYETVDGQAVLNVVLENVVPELTVDSFQSPVVVTQFPYVFQLEGSASEAKPEIYGVPQVQYRIGNGAFVAASPVIGNAARWTAGVSVATKGDTVITVRASDNFGSVTTVQKTLTVLEYPMPTEVDPNVKTTLAGVPTTSSITSWTRLEPQCSNADIGSSSNARLFDPLWLMTRQWQIGEFQGEDTGSPVQARVRATGALLTRCYFGELPENNKAPPYDPTLEPLEAVVERRRMRPAGADDSRMLTLAVEAGLHFLRMLERNATAKKYRPAFLAHYVLQPSLTLPADDAGRRFVQTMVGRAPDARRLASAFRQPDSSQIVFDAALNIAAADRAPVQQVASAWLAWYDGLFTEPGAPSQDAWMPSRLEYAVSVATRLSADPQDALTFSASEFDGGRLDWSSFDINKTAGVDTTGDVYPIALTETTMPAPVSFHGAPAPRFWELEDAKIAYGLVSAGPADVAQMLMIEYASTYGNDWFVVPLNLPVGSVTRIDSLVVTDTFGVRSLLRPIGDPELPQPFFSLWQVSILRRAGESLGAELPTGERIGAPVPNLFFLPPTLGRTIDGAPLEDVLFMRDEMANMGWGIERSIESAIETPLKLASDAAQANSAPPPSTALPRYRLSTTVPDNWIPLLPVQPNNTDNAVSQLRPGAVLQPNSTAKPQFARSEVLKALSTQWLYDEEVPREGVHITRRRHMTRWIDGSTWVWTAFRSEVGTGEGSAGLRFDQIEDGGRSEQGFD